MINVFNEKTIINQIKGIIHDLEDDLDDIKGLHKDLSANTEGELVGLLSEDLTIVERDLDKFLVNTTDELNKLPAIVDKIYNEEILEQESRGEV